MVLDPTERLQQLSDMILSRAINSDDDRFIVTTNLKPEVFTDENFLIYKTMYKFRDRNIVPDEEFLTMFLTRNSKMILENKEQVQPDLFADTGEDVVNSFVTATINKLVRLRGENHSNENLQLLLEKFRIDFKTIYSQKILDVSKLILNDKYEIGRKILTGVDDSENYYRDEMQKLKTLVTSGKQGGIVDGDEKGMSDDGDNQPMKISDFHNLHFLNDIYGGIKTNYMYNIMAPPKSGKSKICYRIAHTTKVLYGNNFAFWAVEGGSDKASAELRAIHFDYYYNVKGGMGYKELSGQEILDDDYPSVEYKELEQVSRADLFTNPNYGKIHYIEDDFKLETYIDSLNAVVTRFGSRLIIVDYLQHIESDSRKTKNEVIGEAYKSTLKFVKKHNVAFISPSQFNQTFLNELSKGKDVDTRLGGGESSEIVRTPDVNIALYGTPEDISNNKLTLLSIPSRIAKPFTPTDIFVDLAFCYFAEATWD